MINFRFSVFDFGLSILQSSAAWQRHREFENLFGNLLKIQAGLALTGWQPVLSRVVQSAA
jgi:hypothetical protein